MFGSTNCRPRVLWLAHKPYERLHRDICHVRFCTGQTSRFVTISQTIWTITPTYMYCPVLLVAQTSRFVTISQIIWTITPWHLSCPVLHLTDLAFCDYFTNHMNDYTEIFVRSGSASSRPPVLWISQIIWTITPWHLSCPALRLADLVFCESHKSYERLHRDICHVRLCV